MPKTSQPRDAASWAVARVPATTSNLGPGFDTLGLALRLYNEARVEPNGDHGVRVTSPIPEDARAGAVNLFNEAAAAFFTTTKTSPFGFDIDLRGDVPMARGLGSSVTARLGCIAALNALQGDPLDRPAILDIVARLEGHPDNAAPAVHGGFTVAGSVDGTIRCLRFAVKRQLEFALVIPDFEISTPEARRLVPSQFSKADAVHNLSRTALITAAFASGDYGALRGCFDDRIHQPHRQPLIPQLRSVIQAGEAAGALGGWLSGSGSTIICATLANPEAVAVAMERALPGSRALTLAADSRGFRCRIGGTLHQS